MPELVTTDSRYRSRKLLFALLAFGTFTALLVTGFIDQKTYATLAGGVVTLYFTANVVQKATSKEAAS